ncbi:hypothetical protein ACFL54_00245 [Planctomycetota bacterium]
MKRAHTLLVLGIALVFLFSFQLCFSDEATQQKYTGLVKEFDGLDLQIKQYRIRGITAEERKKFAADIGDTQESLQECIASDRSNKEYKQLLLKSICAGFYTERLGTYKYFMSQYDDEGAPFPQMYSDQICVNSWETEANQLLADADEYVRDNPNDFWGAKERLRKILAFPGTQAAMAARSGIENCEMNIGLWLGAKSVQTRREKIVYNPKKKKVLEKSIEQLEEELEALSCKVVRNLRRDIRNALRDFDFKEANSCVEQAYAGAYSREQMRFMISILDDYVHDISDFYLLAKLGAYKCIASVMSFKLPGGIIFDAEIVDVDLYGMTLWHLKEQEFVHYSFFELKDSTLCELAHKAGVPDVERFTFAYYIIMDRSTKAADIIKDVTVSTPWKTAYKFDMDRVSRTKELEKKINGVKKKEIKDGRSILRFKSRFGPLFKAVVAQKFGKSIEKHLKPIMSIKPSDFTKECIKEIDALARQETKRSLLGVLEQAMTECNNCSGRRTFTCEKCNGKGKTKSTKKVPGKPDYSVTVTCTRCTGSGQRTCKDCYDRVNRKGTFSKYDKLAAHIGTFISAPKRPRRRGR